MKTNHRYFVTGGTGFIGSHIVRRLVAEQLDVCVLVRPDSSLWRIDDIKDKLTIFYGNLSDYSSVRKCLNQYRPTVIFHLGGGAFGNPWDSNINNLTASLDTNLNGTLYLVKAVQDIELKLKCFIRSGTLVEYGDGPTPYIESQRDQPISIYPAVQATTTMLLNALRYNIDFPIVTLRLASTFGATRGTEYLIPSLITDLLLDRDYAMTNGVQKWDFIYIDDVVNAFLMVVESNIKSGEIINIGSGDEITLKAIAKKIKIKIGGKGSLKIGAISDKSDSLKNLFCDTTKAKKLLNWEPKISIDQGLDITIAWYKNNLGRFKTEKL